jgi:hypothetical protein
MIRATLSTGVAGHVFKLALFPQLAEVFLPAVSSLRPIWHRVVVSRGGSAIHLFLIFDLRFSIEKPVPSRQVLLNRQQPIKNPKSKI